MVRSAGSAAASLPQVLRAVLTAQEHERAVVARMLHEDVGQTLKALLLALGRLPPLPGAGGQREQLEKLTAETLERVRRLALELRPPSLDDLGLGAALRALVSDATVRGGLEVSTTVELPERARCAGGAPEHELALFRAAEEALDNVVEHARATHVSLVATATDSAWHLVVEDDGVGFDVEALTEGQRLGLAYARAWLLAVGGELRLESVPGGGTSVFGRVPVR